VLSDFRLGLGTEPFTTANLTRQTPGSCRGPPTCGSHDAVAHRPGGDTDTPCESPRLVAPCYLAPRRPPYPCPGTQLVAGLRESPSWDALLSHWYTTER
jgi:hypothetical protein